LISSNDEDIPTYQIELPWITAPPPASNAATLNKPTDVVATTSVNPTTRFDPHSVSVAAIRTKPLFATHHFVTGVYQYCQPHMVSVDIPFNCLVEFGSEGRLFIHAAINCASIPLNAQTVVGYDP
jgi:hypothetical protein